MLLLSILIIYPIIEHSIHYLERTLYMQLTMTGRKTAFRVSRATNKLSIQQHRRIPLLLPPVVSIPSSASSTLAQQQRRRQSAKPFFSPRQQRSFRIGSISVLFTFDGAQRSSVRTYVRLFRCCCWRVSRLCILYRFGCRQPVSFRCKYVLFSCVLLHEFDFVSETCRPSLSCAVYVVAPRSTTRVAIKYSDRARVSVFDWCVLRAFGLNSPHTCFHARTCLSLSGARAYAAIATRHHRIVSL